MASKSCPLCAGTGWKLSNDNDVSFAERCECAISGRGKILEENSRIPPLYRNASVENFSTQTDNPMAERELKDVVLVVKSYLREFPNDKKPGLLLMGRPGVGKTHLAVAVLRALMARNFAGIFFDYQTLLNMIMGGFRPESGASERAAYKDALDAEVLFLDDLGARRMTDFVQDTVESIVTHRCNHGMPLIATTNLVDADAGDAIRRTNQSTGKPEYMLDTLTSRLGERVRSRLFEMCRVVRMPVVEDYRMRKTGSR